MTIAEVAKHFMISKEDKVCFNCKYFMQHYIYNKIFHNDFSPCNAGHCVKSRVKDRKPTQMACEHFEWNQDRE